MILSKGLLQTRNTVLTAIKLYKFQTAGFHALRTSICDYSQLNSIAEPLVWNVSTRLESTQAFVAKDTILNLPKTEAIAATVNDGLPEVPIPGAVATPIEIPSIPVSQLPDIVADAVVPLNKLGEPTLESLGLGSPYTPIGWIQKWLELLHVTFDLPWYGAIGITVVIVRVLLFPLVIKSQRNAVKMHNVMPKMMELQQEMQTAKTSGNQIEVLRAGHKLGMFVQDNKINPLSGMTLPLVQAPIFVSFFFALKKMAAVPVESLTTGGALWFVDLTVPDQYYILPLITSTTLYFIILYGVDTGKISVSANVGRWVNLGMKLVPLLCFPFMMTFPSGICIYWMTTNFVSLGQVFFLKIPGIREYFQIEMKKKHEKKKQKSEGFLKDVKSSISSLRVARDIQDRERLDQATFQRAGRMPPAKTFKYDPTVNQELVAKKKFSVK